MLVKCNVLFSFLGKENIQIYDAKLGLSALMSVSVTVPKSSYQKRTVFVSRKQLRKYIVKPLKVLTDYNILAEQ